MTLRSDALRLARRCWDFLRVLPRLKWLSGDLDHPPIIIVDQTGAGVIAELIPDDIRYWVLPVRDEERYLNGRILSYFLAHLPWVLFPVLEPWRVKFLKAY